MSSCKFLIIVSILQSATTWMATECLGKEVLTFSDEFEKVLAKQYGWERYFEYPPKFVRQIYDEINVKLVNSIDDTNAMVNLDKAIEVAGQVKCKILSRHSPKEAVRLLQGLKEHLNSCGMEAFSLLRKNNYAARGKAALFEYSLRPIRRIDKVLEKIFRQHASNCANTHLQRFIEVKNEVDKPDFVVAKAFIDQTLGKIILKPLSVKELLAKNVLSMNASDIFDSFNHSLSIFPHIKYLKFHGDEIRGMEVFDENGLRRIYAKHIIEPCTRYVKQVAHVFIPAAFDFESLNNRFDTTDTKLGRNEFHEALMYYRECLRLVVKPEVVVSAISEYVRERGSRAMMNQ